MTNPLWINESGGQPEYTAAQLRRNMSGLLTKGVPDRLGARPGVIPNGQDAVSLSGVQVTVHDCNLVLNPALSSQDGPYIVHFTEHTHTLSPGDGSNDRIDIIVARVYDDDHDGSSRREAVTEYITGSPSPSPVAPAIPTGALLLREINVPADGTGSPSLGRGPQHTVASGGVLPVRDSSEYPTRGRYPGMVLWDREGEALVAHAGDEWRRVASPNSPETVVFASDGTFEKADYPWARRVWVRVVGGGGAGGGARANGGSDSSAGGGGGGGGYAESILDIDSLSASVSVTVGSGGPSVSGGSGNAGGNSSFGSYVAASGGSGGGASSSSPEFDTGAGGDNGAGTTGQVRVGGDEGSVGWSFEGTKRMGGNGGGTPFGGGGRGSAISSNGVTGNSYGGGGGGAAAGFNLGPFSGGSGAAGVVIVVVI